MKSFASFFITRNLQSLVQRSTLQTLSSPTYYAVHPFNLHMCVLWCVCVCMCVCVFVCVCVSTIDLLPYCWPSPYPVDLLPILLAFSLHYWPSPYTVGLLPILLVFYLYCWLSPFTVGFLPLLLTFPYQHY